MNGEMRIPDYLEHIRTPIERIFRYVEELDAEAFARNELVQDAVIRNLEIIGEASGNIERADLSFTAKHPTIEFSSARAMRNSLSHGYYNIELKIVWETTQDNLSIMHKQIVEILRQLQREK